MPQDAFQDWNANLRQIAMAAARRAAELLANAIKNELKGETRSRPGDPPADPHGTIRESISIAHGDAEAQVVVAARQAACLEYGTSRMSARPFVGPAIEAVRHEVELHPETLTENT